MLYFRRSRFLRFVILPLTLVAFLPACYKWTSTNSTLESPTSILEPVRITLTDGRRMELENAVVRSDSLVGNRKGTQDSISVPLSEVQKVEHMRASALSSLGLVGGIFVVSALASVAYLYFLASSVDGG